jgi:hypothetical protein
VVSVVHESDSGCTRDSVLDQNDGVAAFQACLAKSCACGARFVRIAGAGMAGVVTGGRR